VGISPSSSSLLLHQNGNGDHLGLIEWDCEGSDEAHALRKFILSPTYAMGKSPTRLILGATLVISYFGDLIILDWLFFVRSVWLLFFSLIACKYKALW